MDIKSTVLQVFNQTVQNAPINSELKAALKDSPRVRQFVQNLYQELLGVEALRRSQNKKPLKYQTIKSTVEDFTKVFVRGVDEECNRRIESDLRRIEREAALQKVKDLETSADTGIMTGEFEELSKDGGLIVESTQVQTYKPVGGA